MRFTSTLSAVGLGLTFVYGLDYAAMAATGDSVILGRFNTADAQTTLSRSTAGATLALNSQPGSAPLKVNSPVKVANLNADKLDGLDSSEFARASSVSAFQPPGCQSLTTATSSFAKISDLGTFTKAAGNTLVEIDFSTVLLVQNSGGGTGVVYQLRVDDTASTVGNASTLLRQVGVNATAQIHGIFGGIPAGTHTVSLWAMSVHGDATGVFYDPGCFNSVSTNDVYVTEFR